MLTHNSAGAQCKSSLVGKQKKAEEKENGKRKIVLGQLSCKKEGKLARYIDETVYSKYMRDQLISFTSSFGHGTGGQEQEEKEGTDQKREVRTGGRRNTGGDA